MIGPQRNDCKGKGGISVSLGYHACRLHGHVIELKCRVCTEDRKFREANPQCNGVLECLCVGQTSKTPQKHFAQHKSGARTAKGHKLSSDIVRKYGRYLRPCIYQHISAISRREVLEVEQGLALELRRKGYAVWLR